MQHLASDSNVMIARLFTFILLTILAYPAAAQPELRSARIAYLHPDVEYYWSLACDGSIVGVTKDRLRIIENDSVDVARFDLFCPEPGLRYPVTMGFALDHSGSMTGYGIRGLREAMHALIDRMVWTTDEAAVVWFSTDVTVAQKLTNEAAKLHAAVDALEPSGFTSLYDGIYTALIEIASSASGNARTLVCLTDGMDGSSSRTVAEIIALAQKEHIRIVAISLGSSTPNSDMEMLAMLTGGKYFQTIYPTQLTSIMEEALRLATERFNECSAVYAMPEPCPRGLLRTSRLLFSDVCNDTLSVARTYRSRYDSTQLTPVRFALGVAEVGEDGRARLPLLTDRAFPRDSLPPFTCSIEFGNGTIRFIGLDTTSSAALRPDAPMTFIPGQTSLQWTSLAPAFLTTDTVGLLLFDAWNLSLNDSCDARLTNAVFTDGCLHAIIASGAIRNTRQLQPELSVQDAVMCDTREGTPTTHAVVLRNTGGRPLDIHSIELPDFDTDVLRIVPPIPRLIPARSNAVLLLEQGGQQAGTQFGRLLIESTAPPSGYIREVSVRCFTAPADEDLPPRIPGLVDFGYIGAEIISDTTLLIENPNAAPLRIRSVTIEGPDAELFQLLRAPAAELPAHGMDSLTLRCVFSSTAGLSATMLIDHDAVSVTPTRTALRASVGWPPWPVLQPAYGSLPFDAVAVGDSQVRGYFPINAGGTIMRLGSPRFDGADSVHFAIEEPFPKEIKPFEPQPLWIRFSPRSTGYFHTYLLFATNDPMHPELKIYLYGSGKLPTGIVSAAPLPTALRIHAVYPVPAATSATLAVELAHRMPLRAVLFDMLGRELGRTEFGTMDSGVHQLAITIPPVPSGLYIVLLITPEGQSLLRLPVAR